MDTINREEQLNKIQGMGIKIEGEKSNIVDEFIEKIEKLQEIGVDVSKIVRSDTILKLVGKTIEESEEILIKKIKGMGLEPDYNIGSKLSDLKKVYNNSFQHSRHNLSLFGIHHHEY